MQLMLIVGIVFAIGAVMFALQNNVPVLVTLAIWQFNGSLALVLLVAIGLGALIAGLVSSPTLIRSQWTGSRLRRQVVNLEQKLTEQQAHNTELSAELERLSLIHKETEPEIEKPYVGLRTLLAGEDGTNPTGEKS